jgi:hypothetical protein
MKRGGKRSRLVGTPCVVRRPRTGTGQRIPPPAGATHNTRRPLPYGYAIPFPSKNLPL